MGETSTEGVWGSVAVMVDDTEVVQREAAQHARGDQVGGHGRDQQHAVREVARGLRSLEQVQQPRKAQVQCREALWRFM